MTIVVGVSPTSGSPAALRWGAQEAELRKVPLRAVLAWRPPRPPGAPGGRPPGTPLTGVDVEADAEKNLHDFVAAALGADDGVECIVVKGSAVNALLAAASDAALLVVGEPRQGALAGARVARLVAPHVVLRAPCPVVVMPASAATIG
ncbi:MAG TPA: universal stress protein [Jatrophihabitantaceae bacterium]|jgi:nucleotide-binding universal stress UspA family protein